MLGVSEILAKANALPTREERIAYLRLEGSKPVQIVLQYALHPDLKWLVGPELPEFTPIDAPGQETMLMAEARRLYLFIETPSGTIELSQGKRNVLFVQLLEMLSPDDVTLITHIIKKQLPYENLDYTTVFESFPGILPELTVTTQAVEGDGRPVFEIAVGELNPAAATQAVGEVVKKKRKPRKKKEDVEVAEEAPKKRRRRKKKVSDE